MSEYLTKTEQVIVSVVATLIIALTTIQLFFVIIAV